MISSSPVPTAAEMVIVIQDKLAFLCSNLLSNEKHSITHDRYEGPVIAHNIHGDIGVQQLQHTCKADKRRGNTIGRVNSKNAVFFILGKIGNRISIKIDSLTGKAWAIH